MQPGSRDRMEAGTAFLLRESSVRVAYYVCWHFTAAKPGSAQT